MDPACPRQFLETMLDYQSACHMAVEDVFLNDMGVYLVVVCIPGSLTTDRATGPSIVIVKD